MSMDQDQHQAGGGEAKPSPFSNPKTLLGGGAAALLVVFFLQNLQEVRIDFLMFNFTTNLIWALLGSAACGAVAMWGFSSMRARGARKREELMAKAELQKKKK